MVRTNFCFLLLQFVVETFLSTTKRETRNHKEIYNGMKWEGKKFSPVVLNRTIVIGIQPTASESHGPRKPDAIVVWLSSYVLNRLLERIMQSEKLNREAEIFYKTVNLLLYADVIDDINNRAVLKSTSARKIANCTTLARLCWLDR